MEPNHKKVSELTDTIKKLENKYYSKPWAIIVGTIAPFLGAGATFPISASLQNPDYKDMAGIVLTIVGYAIGIVGGIKLGDYIENRGIEKFEKEKTKRLDQLNEELLSLEEKVLEEKVLEEKTIRNEGSRRIKWYIS